MLIKESYRVLRADPELIWLAFFSLTAMTVLGLVVGIAGLTTGLFDPEAESLSLGAIVLIAIGYFVEYAIVIYFQVALVSAIQHRLAGGDPNVRFGLSQANRRLGAVLSWALIAATVGLVLRLLDQAARSQSGGGRFVAQILVGLLGAAWSVMVFFVIPVIAAEGIGGFAAVKRSWGVIKQRWGEAVVGSFGVSLIMMLATVVVVAVPAVLGMAVIESSTVAGTFFFVIAGVLLVLMIAVSSALDSTYRAVLFAYATTGEVGNYSNGAVFSRTTLDEAFRPKQDLRGRI